MLGGLIIPLYERRRNNLVAFLDLWYNFEQVQANS